MEFLPLQWACWVLTVMERVNDYFRKVHIKTPQQHVKFRFTVQRSRNITIKHLDILDHLNSAVWELIHKKKNYLKTDDKRNSDWNSETRLKMKRAEMADDKYSLSVQMVSANSLYPYRLAQTPWSHCYHNTHGILKVCLLYLVAESKHARLRKVVGKLCLKWVGLKMCYYLIRNNMQNIFNFCGDDPGYWVCLALEW